MLDIVLKMLYTILNIESSTDTVIYTLKTRVISLVVTYLENLVI